MATSPSVYAAQTSGRFSSMPNETGMESPVGSPGSLRGNFASADAARVGGGLYTHLLESLCTLATDPAGMVAEMGNMVLRMAGVQLAPVGEVTGEAAQPVPAAECQLLMGCHLLFTFSLAVQPEVVLQDVFEISLISISGLFVWVHKHPQNENARM